MPDFKFVRTVQYTEVVTVSAQDLEEARAQADEADGDRIHDDRVISLELADDSHAEALIAEVQRAHKLKMAAVEVIEHAFRQEAQHRRERMVEEWHQAEVNAVLNAAQDFALQHGLRAPSREDVVAVERLAYGHCDYAAKWALYVAEKTVPRAGAGDD